MAVENSKGRTSYEPVGAKDFVEGMRRLAAGVTIIATEHQNSYHGLASTAVTSVTADPATILVCVNTSASSHDAILGAKCFTANILSEDDLEVAQLFGSSQNRERRFLTRDWSPLKTGAPALEGALAVFDCQVKEAVRVSSHTMFLGEVVAVRYRDDKGALLYWDRAYRKFAPGLLVPKDSIGSGLGLLHDLLAN